MPSIREGIEAVEEEVDELKREVKILKNIGHMILETFEDSDEEEYRRRDANCQADERI